ncbi:ADP-dependent (S)-NAD(P)H-hydrate dehydratase [uncultured archaeon]|nr:ADP-dependent (S)-NAD(P)H-hydrate dehydratase [uncultured archaeon]
MASRRASSSTGRFRPPRARCSPADWRALRLPSKSSHKGDNGRLLILAGSSQYSGSLILAALAAVRFCDLIYVHSTDENLALVSRLKRASPNLIVVRKNKLAEFWRKADAFLLGPGWEDNRANRALLARAISSQMPVVLDATALRMLKPNQIRANLLLTPHAGEFKALFGEKATARSVFHAAKKSGCTLLCKGPADFIASPARFKTNSTHHVGMTKGGTGDVLAGLCAALAADHNDLFSSACAAAYLNGMAGLRLSKKMGAHYSSLDLASELPRTAHLIECGR